ncbi:MAG: alpha/beta hydrolase [Rhodocyclaceae bacterium]|jgi:pimeloyl-ACP methyl ester carboxylesterase|nr:alpha/beta hydrolase [Rhodocyclaceae bacterium]
MELTLAGQPVYVYTGGRAFDPALPTVLLIHGAGHDHSVWNHQARHLAHHGFSVLVPDHPGHGRSGGPALGSIEAVAGWMVRLLDHLNLERVAAAGHSMGSLIALELAATNPHRISHLVLVGSVAPMPVAEPLLEAARSNRDAAHGMINHWSYAPASQLGASALPGFSLPNLNRRILERQAEGVLASDLAACNAYMGGLESAARIRCPVAMLCGERDQMTPRRAAAPLAEALGKTPCGARMITIQGAGHAMMAEAPDAVTDSIRGFLTQA